MNARAVAYPRWIASGFYHHSGAGALRSLEIAMNFC